MRKLLLALLLLLAVPAMAQNVSLNGGNFQLPAGAGPVVNGTVTLKLSVADGTAKLISTGAAVQVTYVFTLDSHGNFPPGSSVTPNGAITPFGTYYSVLVKTAGGKPVGVPATWCVGPCTSYSGAPFPNVTVLQPMAMASLTTGPFEIMGNRGLPVATPGSGAPLWFAAGFGSPIVGKVYVGDGTGWEFDFAKRTSSTDTSLFKFKDSGEFDSGSVVSKTSPWADIRAYGAKCDDSTDDTTALNKAIAANCGSSTSGGSVYIPPSDNGCKIAGQVTMPNNGATPPLQKSCKIFGAASGGVLQFFPDGGCNGGSTLDMTFRSSTGKIDSRGLGKLEIEGICFKDSNTDFTPWIFDTLTMLHVHNNQFYGNPSHFPVGCCSSVAPTQDGQPGIVLGGTSTSTGTGAATDFFQGYGTSIDHNQFDYCGKAVLLQNQTNSVNVESNHFFNHCTNTTDAPITLNPGAGATQIKAAVIKGNLIEVGGSKYGVHVVGNSTGADIDSNGCWDANIGVITVNCVKIEASANNTLNHVINPSPDTNTGDLPDSVTSSDSRQQNGRFLAAVGLTAEQNCTQPAFGASHVDGFGLSINGGALQACSSSHVTHILDSDHAGDIDVLSAGGLYWQNQATTLVANGAVDTSVTRGTAGRVTFGTTQTSGDETADLGFRRALPMGGTAVVSGDFNISAARSCNGITSGSWGSAASISSVAGTDTAGKIVIASGGTGQSADPCFAFTFHDGAFPGTGTIPIVTRSDLSSPQNVGMGCTTGPSAIACVFTGTAVAGQSYQFNWIIVGR